MFNIVENSEELYHLLLMWNGEEWWETREEIVLLKLFQIKTIISFSLFHSLSLDYDTSFTIYNKTVSYLLGLWKDNNSRIVF